MKTILLVAQQAEAYNDSGGFSAINAGTRDVSVVRMGSKCCLTCVIIIAGLEPGCREVRHTLQLFDQDGKALTPKLEGTTPVPEKVETLTRTMRSIIDLPDGTYDIELIVGDKEDTDRVTFNLKSWN